jgi:hypothetical protein
MMRPPLDYRRLVTCASLTALAARHMFAGG